VRLDISSSNFPHFDLNMNTGASFSDQRVVVADNTVYHCNDFPSRLILPVVGIPPPRLREAKRKAQEAARAAALAQQQIIQARQLLSTVTPTARSPKSLSTELQ